MVDIITAENLIINLEKLSTKGYVFRGQQKSEYKLTPSIFRNDKYTKLYQDFSVKADMHKYNVAHPTVRKVINSWAPGILRDNGAEEIVNRLCRLIIFKMLYNYNLATYFRTLSQVMQDSYAKILTLRPVDSSTTEETFLNWFRSEFPHILRRTHPLCDKIVFQEAEPFEDLAVVDETLPQHYGTPTAALDWTYDPYIAIFFAIENYNIPIENSILYKAAQIPSACFSIYAYKQHVEDKAPVYLNKECIKENIRQQRQLGVFTCFSKPCSFYLKNNRFPSIEDYYDKQQFPCYKKMHVNQ